MRLRPHVDAKIASVGGRVRYRRGQQVRGKAHNVLRTPIVFDGNKLHFTERLTSERYAVVYFCQGVLKFSSIVHEIMQAVIG